MKTSYLIFWQLGDNEQSIDETAIDVFINKSDTAKEKYKKILRELEHELENEIGDYSCLTVRAIYRL